jgi:hypothetical protein
LNGLTSNAAVKRRILQEWQEFPFRVAAGRDQLFSDLLTPAEEAVMPAYMLDCLDIVSQLDERRPQLGRASRVVGRRKINGGSRSRSEVSNPDLYKLFYPGFQLLVLGGPR